MVLTIFVFRSKSGTWQWDRDKPHQSLGSTNESDRLPRSSTPANSTANSIDSTMPAEVTNDSPTPGNLLCRCLVMPGQSMSLARWGTVLSWTLL